MDGLVFTINKLGQSLATAELAITQRDQRIAQLEAALRDVQGGDPPAGAPAGTPPTPAPQTPAAAA